MDVMIAKLCAEARLIMVLSFVIISYFNLMLGQLSGSTFYWQDYKLSSVRITDGSGQAISNQTLELSEQIIESVFNSSLYTEELSLLVENDPRYLNPVTPNRKKGKSNWIVLSCKSNTYWANWVYQFGHEIIHLAHSGNYERNSAGLIEEAICELGSQLALRQAYLLSSESSSSLKDYAANFLTYLADSESRYWRDFEEEFANSSRLERLKLISKLGSTQSRAFNARIAYLMSLHVWNVEDLKTLLELTQLPEEAFCEPHLYKDEIKRLSFISRKVFMTINTSL